MWPNEQDLPGFKRDLTAYHTESLTFARRLTGIFVLALGVDEHCFDEYTRHPEAGMRVVQNDEFVRKVAPHAQKLRHVEIQVRAHDNWYR